MLKGNNCSLFAGLRQSSLQQLQISAGRKALLRFSYPDACNCLKF